MGGYQREQRRRNGHGADRVERNAAVGSVLPERVEHFEAGEALFLVGHRTRVFKGLSQSG
jgi:hypothetical protein